MFAGRRCELKCIVQHRVRNVRRTNRSANTHDLLGVQNGFELVDGMRFELRLHDLAFHGERRIAHVHRDREAVHLSLRQGIRAVMLDRILRCDQKERFGKSVSDTIDGDCVLVHRLEQSRLGPRRRAIDLVHQNDVRENGAGHELEALRDLVVDRGAGDVTRQQVWCGLDPLELAPDRAGQRPRQHRLAHSGHVLDE
jgi:hypothetical protein